MQRLGSQWQPLTRAVAPGPRPSVEPSRAVRRHATGDSGCCGTRVAAAVSGSLRHQPATHSRSTPRASCPRQMKSQSAVSQSQRTRCHTWTMAHHGGDRQAHEEGRRDTRTVPDTALQKPLTCCHVKLIYRAHSSCTVRMHTHTDTARKACLITLIGRARRLAVTRCCRHGAGPARELES